MKKLKQKLYRAALRWVARIFGRDIVNAWVYFCFNYPDAKEWMYRKWGKVMGDHFWGKFEGICDRHSSAAVMNTFWTECDDTHRDDLYEFFRKEYANGQYF